VGWHRKHSRSKITPELDPAKSWSDKSFGSLPITGFPAGPALVTLFTNGIPSTAKYLVVSETP